MPSRVALFDGVRVRVRDERSPAVDRFVDPCIRKVEAFGPAVDLDPRSGLDRSIDDRVEVHRMRLALLQKPAGGMRERGHEGVAHRADDASRHLLARLRER